MSNFPYVVVVPLLRVREHNGNYPRVLHPVRPPVFSMTTADSDSSVKWREKKKKVILHAAVRLK